MKRHRPCPVGMSRKYSFEEDRIFQDPGSRKESDSSTWESQEQRHSREDAGTGF